MIHVWLIHLYHTGEHYAFTSVGLRLEKSCCELNEFPIVPLITLLLWVTIKPYRGRPQLSEMENINADEYFLCVG